MLLLLDCLRGIVAQPAPWPLPGEVDPGFWSSSQSLFLCCHDWYRLSVLPFPATGSIPKLRLGHAIQGFVLSWWFQLLFPIRFLSSLIFYIASFLWGASFLFSLISVVSSWVVSLMLASPWPPTFCLMVVYLEFSSFRRHLVYILVLPSPPSASLL